MIKTGFFGEYQRIAKLNKLGDALQLMEQHVDLAAFSADLDHAVLRPSANAAGIYRFQPS